jgi:hypothetical protein
MKRKSLLALLLFFIFSTLIFTQVQASSQNDLQSIDAAVLVKLNVLSGYPDGSLKLQNNIKRSEFVTLVIRMLGYDKDLDTSAVAMTFKDISKTHWAYNNMKLALKYKLISGYPDNTIGPEKNVTYAETLTVLLRALGYENAITGKWPDNVLNKAAQLEITKNLNLTADKQMTRGEISVLIYNSLTTALNK